MKRNQSTDHMNSGKDPNADLGTPAKTPSVNQGYHRSWRDAYGKGSDADNNGYPNHPTVPKTKR